MMSDVDTVIASGAQDTFYQRLASLFRWQHLGMGLVLLALGVAVALLPAHLALFSLAGVVVVLVVLLRPAAGLGLLALIIPFSTVRQFSVAGASLGASEAILLLSLGAWAAIMVARRQLRMARAPLVLPFLAFIGVQAISLLNSQSLTAAAPELLKWVEMLLLYLCAASILQPRQVLLVVGAMLLAGSLEALLGLYQFWRQVGPEFFVLLGRFMRAYGTFSQPNPFGGYLGLVLPLGLTMLLLAARRGWGALRSGPDTSPSRTVRHAVAIAAYALATVLLLAGIIASWSRGAWLGAIVSVPTVLLLHIRRPSVALFVTGLLVAVLLLIPQPDVVPTALSGRLTDLTDYVTYATDPDIGRIEINDANFAVLERVAHWRAAIGMFGSQPWFGVGIGNYAPAYSSFALPRWENPLGHAHNQLLHFLAETGLIGLASYIALWVAAFVGAWRAMRTGRDLQRAVAIGVLGLIAHLSVHGLVDNLYVQGMYLHIAIALGALEALRQHSPDRVSLAGAARGSNLAASDAVGCATC